MAREADRHIDAVAAALEILSCFDADERLRLKDLNARTGTNQSRLLRLLGTLEAHGFIERHAEESSYSLGVRIYALGRLLDDRYSREINLIRPFLQRLVSQTGDTAFFSNVQGNDRYVVASEESSEGLRFIVKEGQLRPLLAGASGKILLAFGPPALLERAVEVARNEGREVDIARLKDELGTIAEVGFAISRGEVTAYGFAVAVPVARADRAGADALTLAGPLAKLTDEKASQHVERLTEAAGRLKLALAHTLQSRPKARTAAE